MLLPRCPSAGEKWMKRSWIQFFVDKTQRVSQGKEMLQGSHLLLKVYLTDHQHDSQIQTSAGSAVTQKYTGGMAEESLPF